MTAVRGKAVAALLLASGQAVRGESKGAAKQAAANEQAHRDRDARAHVL